MTHDSPLPGGYTPGSVEGSMQLKELTNLCTKLVARVTSLERKLKNTKEVHDVEEENGGVEYDFDLTEQQVTLLKTSQVEEQSQEMFEAELSILGAAKNPCRDIKERVKTYNRRIRSTDSSQVSTAVGLLYTAKDIQDTNEELAKKVQEEEQTKVLEQWYERISHKKTKQPSKKRQNRTQDGKVRKGVHVPLFDTMLLHDQPGQGEGPTVSVESQHTSTASSPSKS
ncbi:hypothetical protein Tco_0115622 [Tanacetum coccineum]